MGAPQTLQEWLAHCERVHPKTTERPLQTVQEVLARLELPLQAPVITVAGTNGKGSTCAMLEAIALSAGYRVGTYTKPHLVRFEERCRINGAPIEGESLVPHFAAVEAARQGRLLSWFGFTTLAILSAFSRHALDLLILEVGLGGRLDPVNAIDTDCAVITSIDLDHMALLGPDRESIGLEKAHVMRAGRPAIISDPMPPRSVVEHGLSVGADLWLAGRDFRHAGDRQQWSWVGRGRRYAGLGYPALRGANQLVNASGVLAALESLRPRLPVPAQAIRAGLAAVELPGRFQIVPGKPTLVLDVAHNEQSVATLAVNLDQMGFYPRTLAVFGAMADKDIDAMLRHMAALVDGWHFCDLDTPRAEAARELAERWARVPALSTRPQRAPSQAHANPRMALQAALDEAGPDDRIVVFGSFHTVGAVLEAGVPALAATHIG